MDEPQPGLRPVVYVATCHDWFSYQHFYQGLARAFATSRPLLYVGGVTTSRQTRDEELRHVSENIWLLRVRVPKGGGRRVLRPIRDRLIARAVKRALHRLGWDAPPVVWTYTTDAAPLLRSLPTAASVYWTGDEVVDAFESALLRAVDHVFTVSPAATALKRTLFEPSRVSEMPMAVDPSLHEQAARDRTVPNDIADLPRPWLGYGGAVNARTNWDLIDALARATRGTVVIVGPAIDDEGRRQMARTNRPGNVVFLGHRDAETAAHYVAAFDVGLIPYTLSAFNVGSNPTKTYDYLAAGIPVVATDLPAIRALAPHVAIASDDAEFVATTLALAARQPSEAERRQRQQVAREHSYDALVALVDAVLAGTGRDS